MAAELIVSVSGINSRTLPHLREFRRQLHSRNVPLSLFVAPRLKNGYQLDRDDKTVSWIRRRRDDGYAIVLNGYDEAATKRMRSEFATLPAHEANLRLLAADRMLGHLGLRTRMFSAPGWTTSAGTEKALVCNGFRTLITRAGTVDLVRESTQPSRIIGVGAGFLSEPWWCRTLVQSVERSARRGGTVRIAIAARHLAKPAVSGALLDAADLALKHGCLPAVYRWERGPALKGVA